MGLISKKFFQVGFKSQIPFYTQIVMVGDCMRQKKAFDHASMIYTKPYLNNEHATDKIIVN